MDYDKKPLFIDEESSNDSESDEEHLVTNMANLQQLQKLHSNNSVKQTK